MLLQEILLPSSARLLVEGKTSDGRLILKGKLQEANIKNANGRIYPKKILTEKVNEYVNKFVNNRTSLGELDHPSSEIVNLQHASHIITKIWFDGDDVMGTIELLDTPSGKIAKAIVEANIPLGISSRAMGSVKQIEEGTVEVQDDLTFASWDIVSNPSTPSAYMKLQENTQSRGSYERINSLIMDIICDPDKNEK